MLEIRHLEKSFGDKQVLFGVDLTAQQGHILGLVGKNGAGKTTISTASCVFWTTAVRFA